MLFDVLLCVTSHRTASKMELPQLLPHAMCRDA